MEQCVQTRPRRGGPRPTTNRRPAPANGHPHQETFAPDMPGPIAASDFARLSRLLHTRARALTASRADAADLAQDAVLAVWRRHRTGAQIDDLRAYAMAALRNAARTRWRSRRDWDDLDEAQISCAPDAPRRIACAEVGVALSRLPRAQAQLMRLVAQGETSPRALADLTGVPLGTVMSRLARARARLRAELGLSKSASTTQLFEDTT